MIKINKILKKYKDFSLLIKDLEIKEGQVVGFAGANGAGKTTLSEIILGIQKADEFDGIIKEKLKFNAVFQESAFQSEFKVKETFLFFMKLFGIPKTQIDDELRKFDLLKIKEKKNSDLSSGQKQKVKIAVAFMNNPDLILLDEVSTALDIVWQSKITDIISSFKKKNPKSSIIVISHDPESIIKLCDVVYLLKDGKNVDKLIINDDINEETFINTIKGLSYE